MPRPARMDAVKLQLLLGGSAQSHPCTAALWTCCRHLGQQLPDAARHLEAVAGAGRAEDDLQRGREGSAKYGSIRGRRTHYCALSSPPHLCPPIQSSPHTTTPPTYLRMLGVPVNDEVPVRSVGEHARAVVEQPPVGRGEECAHAAPQGLLVGTGQAAVDVVGVHHLVEVVVQPDLEACGRRERRGLVREAAGLLGACRATRFEAEGLGQGQHYPSGY